MAQQRMCSSALVGARNPSAAKSTPDSWKPCTRSCRKPPPAPAPAPVAAAPAVGCRSSMKRSARRALKPSWSPCLLVCSSSRSTACGTPMTTRPSGAVCARPATFSKSCSHWLVSTMATKASGRIDGSAGSSGGGGAVCGGAVIGAVCGAVVVGAVVGPQSARAVARSSLAKPQPSEEPASELPPAPPRATSPRRPPASPRPFSLLLAARLPTAWFSLSYLRPATEPLARPSLARRAGAKWASARTAWRSAARSAERRRRPSTTASRRVSPPTPPTSRPSSASAFLLRRRPSSTSRLSSAARRSAWWWRRWRRWRRRASVLGEVASSSKSARTIARSDGEMAISNGEIAGTTGVEMVRTDARSDGSLVIELLLLVLATIELQAGSCVAPLAQGPSIEPRSRGAEATLAASWSWRCQSGVGALGCSARSCSRLSSFTSSARRMSLQSPSMSHASVESDASVTW